MNTQSLAAEKSFSASEQAQHPCFHCGEEVTDQGFTVAIQGKEQDFCCPACANVAQLIIDQGFDQYYTRRDNYSTRPSEKADASWWDLAEIQQSYVSASGDNSSALLQIEGIHCAACCWLIEQHLLKLDGIKQAQVSLQQQKAIIDYDPAIIKPSAIADAILQLGYTPSPWQANKAWENYQQQRKNLLKRLGVAGIGMMQVGMCAIGMYAGDFQGMEMNLRRLLQVYSMIVTAFVLVYSCQPFFVSAWRGITQKKPGMDVPVSLAMSIAFFASVYNTANYHTEVYFDAVCMFAFFLLLARYIELLSREDQIRDSQKLLPDTAWTDDGQQVSVHSLVEGDTVLVKAGDQLPADVEVTAAEAQLDESAFSGESLPVTKQTGEIAFAGSINQGSSFTAKVLNTGHDTRLYQVSQLLDSALLDKPRISQLADRLSVWFIAAVLILALATAAYWALIAVTPASNTFVIVLAVLVVSCPCALSLATPVALASSGFYLKKKGLAIRSSHFLEALPAIDTIVFDKTGTLTQASLQLCNTVIEPGFDEQTCLSLIAAMEQHSNHPLAKVFVGIQALDGVTDIQEQQSQGMQASFQGKTWRFGKPSFAAADVSLPDQQGHWLLLSCNHQPAAWFDIRDALRPGSLDTVTELQQRYPVSILSGDQQQATALIAAELDVKDFHAGQSAEDKLAFIKNLQQQGHKVLMIGDGINDAPVLAQADVSIAADGANDLSKSRADAYLLGRLELIPLAIRHARKTRQIIKQNLLWALLYNFSAIPLAMAGLVPPWLAAIGMSLSSVFVCLNAQRLNPTKSS